MRTRSTFAYWRVTTAAGCIIAGTLLSGPAHAAISSASGKVEATVQQTNASTGQTIDQAFEESPGTTNILPAEAQAGLDITTAAAVQGRLSCVAAVNVPGGNAPVDTNDFAIEAAGLSLLDGRGFTSGATATQTRQITLSAAEVNLRTGARVRVSSHFVFASGVFLVTLPDGPSDVTGHIQFAVQQQDDQGSREVLAGALDVSFDAAGKIHTAVSGALVGVTPLLVDLSSQSSKVRQADLVLLPGATIPYEYQATVGQPFSLVATVETHVDCPSGNQGGSAFVGRLPRLLADSANEFLKADFTSDLDILAQSQGQIPTGLPGGVQITPITDGSVPSCGNFGLETLLGGALLTAVSISRRFA